jgi:hypothetical protein
LGQGLNLSFREESIFPGEELHGSLEITYQGRFDSLVINSQIENSSKAFMYTELNGKKIKHPYGRLSVFRTELRNSVHIEFTAITLHVPEGEYSNVKFRASIIQEHKEVGADVVYIKVLKRA